MLLPSLRIQVFSKDWLAFIIENTLLLLNAFIPPSLTDIKRFINILSLAEIQAGKNEKNFPAKQEKKKEESWISCSYEN
jgi:hypothetical protein